MNTYLDPGRLNGELTRTELEAVPTRLAAVEDAEDAELLLALVASLPSVPDSSRAAAAALCAAQEVGSEPGLDIAVIARALAAARDALGERLNWEAEMHEAMEAVDGL